MLIDTHCHLQDPDLAPDVDGVLSRAAENGIDTMLCVGYDMPSSREAVRLARLYPQVYAIIGVHPHDAATYTPEAEAELKELAAFEKVVAIGEIGLDYFREETPHDLQQDVFARQIRLAHALRLPIVIHDRDAHEDTVTIIKRENGGLYGGVMHCFSGHLPMALDLVKENFYISFAGPLTFKNNKKGQEAAGGVPLDRLLVETDSPYLSPEPRRGKRNEPENVRFTAAKLAEIKGVSPEEMARITRENACRIFGLHLK